MATHNSGPVQSGTPATAPGEDETETATHFRRAFSVHEFCVRYGIGRTNAYQEIAAGRLRAVKVGRRTLIPYDAAEAWLAALPELNSPSRTSTERREKQS
jgi:excisionase family DNA binding protein